MSLCEGDACDGVSIEWDADVNQYLVLNRTDRPVRVSLLTWPASTEFVLEPFALRHVNVSEIEHPFLAVFIESATGVPISRRFAL